MKYLFLVLPLAIAACGSSAKKEAKETAQKVEAKAGEAKNKAEKKAASSSADVSCKLGEEVRKLEVVKSESGCTLQYTKAGNTNEIASGGVGSEHCQNVSDKIKGNLESAGFKCE